jgi:type II secretory pathway component PulM
MFAAPLQKIEQFFISLNDQLLSNPVARQLWSFYESRSLQERSIIRASLFIVFSVFIWFAIFSPISSYANAAHQQYLLAKADLTWMQENREKARQLGSLSQQPIAEIIPASPLAPFVVELKPDESGESAILVLSAVPFNILVESLRAIAINNGIQISAATLERNPVKSGYVQATLTLERN